MGIKFRCPQGHKLNVKSFQAGKRGVCPKCGVSLRIPMESQLDQSGTATAVAEEPDADDEPEDLVGDAFPGIRIETGSSGRATAQRSNGSAAVAPAPAADAPAERIASPFSETKVEAARIAVADKSGADPIAEAPEAIWYVRPPNGSQQYGPAGGDIMRRWLSEGRVSSDSLVWREGWTDWQLAGQAFASLRSPATPAGPIPPTPPAPSIPKSSQPAADTGGPSPRPSRLVDRYQAQRKQGSSLGIVAVIALGLLCLLLGVLLVYFVGGFHNGGTPTPAAATKAEAE